MGQQEAATGLCGITEYEEPCVFVFMTPYWPGVHGVDCLAGQEAPFLPSKALELQRHTTMPSFSCGS